MASNAVSPLEAEVQVDSTRADALLDHSWHQSDGFPRESDALEAPTEHLQCSCTPRALQAHGTTQAARGGSLPCSLGSASAPRGCPVPWTLPGDHASQDRTAGGRCQCLAGPPRVTKIEPDEIPIFGAGLYIDLESDAATHVLERADFAPQRVLRDAKEAIGPPTAA